jgi:hypothetical protein
LSERTESLEMPSGDPVRPRTSSAACNCTCNRMDWRRD